jgi:RimJ/RimL family protein N-acetyltransferase
MIQAILDNWMTGNAGSFTFTICLQTCQECIGIIGINLGNLKQQCRIWFKFDPAYWNKDATRGRQCHPRVWF